MRTFLGGYELLLLCYALVAAVLIRQAVVRRDSNTRIWLSLAMAVPSLGFAATGHTIKALALVEVPKTAFADLTSRSQATERNSTLAALKLTEEPLACRYNYKNVLIVVGESATRDRMSLWGYTQSTTPMMAAMSRTPWTQFRAPT